MQWDISTAAFLQKFDVSTKDTMIRGVAFKPDGSKMYVVGQTNNKVYEYDLLTAWNVSTATFLYDLSVAAKDTSPEGVAFKTDGTKMYVVGSSSDSVHEYDLSTAWNISTAVWLHAKDISGEDVTPTGVAFKSSGSKMYVVGQTNNKVYEYDLLTAWNVSTAAHTPGQEKDVSGEDTSSQDVAFKQNGLKMYVVGSNNDKVYEYDLSTAWTVSTAVYLQDCASGGGSDSPTGISLRPDGLKMYIARSHSLHPDYIYEYDLPLVTLIKFGAVSLTNPKPFQITESALINAVILESGKQSIQASTETSIAVSFQCHTSDYYDISALFALIGTKATLEIDGIVYPNCYISRPPTYRQWFPGEWEYDVSFIQETA